MTAMFKLSLLVVGVSLGITACATQQYSTPKDLRFQDNSNGRNQVLHVERDEKLCNDDTLENQKCPINLYIDNFLAGSFYANNRATYYLKPELYSFKVKNCTTEECKTCDIDIRVDQLTDRKFTLTVDALGKPFIVNSGKPLLCQ